MKLCRLDHVGIATASSLRAQRSNPVARTPKPDCFVAAGSTQ
jgi:hypothetical protein